MSSQDSVRQRIISSVFSKRSEAGEFEETYVTHVKIWESDTVEKGGQKPRYIRVLSQGILFGVTSCIEGQLEVTRVEHCSDYLLLFSK